MIGYASCVWELSMPNVGRRADWTPIGALTSCFLLTHRGQHRALNNSLVAGQLQTLPAPLGFRPHGIDVGSRKSAFQQRVRPDPPPASA